VTGVQSTYETRVLVAVFEVLSREDTIPRMKRKLEDYRAMGIAQIWVIDPEESSYSQYVDG
jgi:Uma2 family endonuclease